jgi:phosphomannomutase
LNEQQLISKSSKIGIAGDLRNSTPRIMNAAAAACLSMGFESINYGYIPSPAIALLGLKQQIPTIMVTGSHIPDDRNGIKFNTPLGEILKPDEEGIRTQQIVINETLFDELNQLKYENYLNNINPEAEQYYIQRYIDFLPDNCLKGKHIGLYEHSSVARDCFKAILQQLGATITLLGRSEQFISVDTEAIRPEDVVLAKQWAQQYLFDCIISTDGDADRPLISDEKGNWLRGDVAGILSAQYLNADTVITPVSSNTAVDKTGSFTQVIRTKIGSPYVIEAMQQAQRENKTQTIVGYEANGGFLQQTVINKDNRALAPLPTRDAAIVPLTILLLAHQQNTTISQLLNTLPQRYTHSDRLKAFASEKSQQLIMQLIGNDTQTNLHNIKILFPSLTNPVAIDNTDGVRITLDNDDIVHLRPSGNAPELRCYCEASSMTKAVNLCEYVMRLVTELSTVKS